MMATAIIAAISDITQFKNGRQCAAWLGVVPREHSTGGKPRLLGISKRGNIYPRCVALNYFLTLSAGPYVSQIFI